MVLLCSGQPVKAFGCVSIAMDVGLESGIITGPYDDTVVLLHGLNLLV